MLSASLLSLPPYPPPPPPSFLPPFPLTTVSPSSLFLILTAYTANGYELHYQVIEIESFIPTLLPLPLPPSLPPSLTLSLTPSLPPSLTHSLPPPSLPHCLTHFTPSLSPSLHPSLPPSLTHSPPSFPPRSTTSLPYSLRWSCCRVSSTRRAPRETAESSLSHQTPTGVRSSMRTTSTLGRAMAGSKHMPTQSSMW